ncbi:MAG TPA: hypothetical protein ENF80_01080 [Thermofilum sp.]|nr:hypothetical protein [Thermofilum sp.]
MEVCVKVPREMKEIVEILASKHRKDEKTVIRELLRDGLKDRVIEMYAKGEVSLSMAAEVLGISVYEVIKLALSKGYQIGSGETEHSIRYVEEMLRKMKKRT